MIHPVAATDPFLAPMHRSFLISSFVSGAAALIVLPLHLAFAGPPHAAVLVVLTWMMSQWPLALYLSRSGALNRTIGLSSALFACLVAAICLMTGGPRSFALVWLLVPLMETAFSTDRKTPLAVMLLSGGLLAGVALAPLPPVQVAMPEGNVPLYTMFGALLYTGVLCFRLTLDRLAVQGSVSRSQSRLRTLGQGMSDVVCELASDGTIRILGGPITKLIGPLPIADGEDWLFPRLHVADRPLYLTHLSDARHSGETMTFDVRFRIGATSPGEAGLPDYRRLVLTLQPSHAEGAGAHGDDRPLVLTLKGEDLGLPECTATAAVNEEDLSGRLSRCLEDIAGTEATTVLSVPPGQVERPVAAAAPAIVARTRGGEEAPSVMVAAERPESLVRAVDILACLEQCRDLLAPVASRRGVLLDLAAGHDLPMVASEPKGLRQALYYLLADMIETSGEGALLTVSAETASAELDCVLSVRNRPSGLPWCADGSELVFESAASLLERTGGRLSVRSLQGHGDSVIVHLPLCAEAIAAERLAKTA